MDCAEGSYGQIVDHLGDQAKVDECIRTMRAVVITHIHGDHQLGVLKILAERDKLKVGEKIYIAAPNTLIPWLKIFVEDSLKRPEEVVIVPTTSFNPESHYYYEPNR